MILPRYDLDSMTPLHRAAGTGEVAELVRLLGEGADTEARADGLTGAHDAVKRELTPLMVAAGSERGSAAAVQALLEHGANPRAVSAGGVEALWYAAGAGDPDRVAAMLAPSGDSNAVANGRSAVALPAPPGNAEALRLLLGAGASPQPPGGPSGYTTASPDDIPLFVASLAGCADGVKALLGLGASAAALASDKTTALMHAGTPEVVSLLLDA